MTSASLTPYTVLWRARLTDTVQNRFNPMFEFSYGIDINIDPPKADELFELVESHIPDIVAALKTVYPEPNWTMVVECHISGYDMGRVVYPTPT